MRSPSSQSNLWSTFSHRPKAKLVICVQMHCTFLKMICIPWAVVMELMQWILRVTVKTIEAGVLYVLPLNGEHIGTHPLRRCFDILAISVWPQLHAWISILVLMLQPKVLMHECSNVYIELLK